MASLVWRRACTEGDFEEWTAVDVLRNITFLVCPSPDGEGGWNRFGWRLFRRGVGCVNFTSPDRYYPSRDDAKDAAEPL